MPRPKAPNGRANQAVVDTIHGYAAQAILDSFKRYRKEKELPPPNFLAQALKFLQSTDSTAPTRSVTKTNDRLADLLAEYKEEDLDGTGKPGAIVDFTQREFPDDN